jgi:hypothetical protein
MTRLVVVALLWLIAFPAEAQTDAAACADAFERGQVQRREGKLLAARRDFVFCAQQQCPEAIQQQCTSFHTDVDKMVPSIVISAIDSRGRDVVDVSVRIDGKPAGARLEGKPIELDPGEHIVRLEREGMKPVEQAVLVAEGQRAKLVRIELPIGGATSQARVTPPADDGPGLVLAGIGFGVAGAALVAGIVTGVLAMQAGEPCRDGDLACNETYIADEQPLAHASTACFAVAGAGAIVGIVGVALYATRPTTGAVELGFSMRGSF